MSRRVNAKWRPSLAFVLGGPLAAVFFLPLIGIGYFRIAGGVLGWAETAWMIGWMAFAATAILGFLLWRLVLRPVRAITDYARAEGAADVPVHFGTPEFSQLGQSVIAMTQTLQGREAVLRSYADHVTHEFKSPLTVVRGAAELLDDPALAPADRAKMLGNIVAAVDRMQALLDGQRALAQAQDPMPRGSCRLSDVVAGRGVVVTQDAQVPFSAELLAVVMTHLIGNAHAHGATQIDIAAGPDQIRVSDNGPGISQGNRSRIFDPFFTTRRDDGGTGMGLAIVRRMLETQGAEITLCAGTGAVFEITY
ncbi:ATP-binding protein [Yoonia sp. I 8.24]|uniref:ATP-binding protein n=1 Tax=Yoonia sp. I 8.24 TaxID=1537229 RepID=UPI001EDD9EE3|nr:ATP-binding protein [Yoonia sp. I 8.24]MCG3268754.1 two-component sensor histidine kinase [Yoonia sp. I 8.24]